MSDRININVGEEELRALREAVERYQDLLAQPRFSPMLANGLLSELTNAASEFLASLRASPQPDRKHVEQPMFHGVYVATWTENDDGSLTCDRCGHVSRDSNDTSRHARTCCNTPSDGSVAEKNAAAGNSGPAQAVNEADSKNVDWKTIVAEIRTSRDEERKAQEAQRRSFALGNVSIDNPNVTRDMIDRAADQSAPNDASSSAANLTHAQHQWLRWALDPKRAPRDLEELELAMELVSIHNDPTLALREAYRDACVAFFENQRLKDEDACIAAKRALDAAKGGA